MSISEDLEGRVARWVATADPDALWPDVPGADRLAAHGHIVSAARSVLTGSSGVPLPAPTPAAVKATGIAAFESGMGPLLGYWAERGQLQVSSPLRDVLATHLHHGRRRAKALRSVAARILRSCRERAVEPTLLKGLHTGDAYFPDAGTRVGTDIDLLVRPEEFAAACAALTAAGLQESRRTRNPFRSEWTPIGPPPHLRSLEFTHAENPWSVDLHVTLDRYYPGRIRARFGPDAHRYRVPYDFSGEPAAVLAEPLRAAYLATHACWGIHEIQLVRLIELVLVLKSDTASGHLNISELSALLTRTGTHRFAYPAFALAEYLVPGTVDPGLLRELESAANRSARRIVAALAATGSLRLPSRSLEEKLMWASGLREYLGFFVAELVPSGPSSLGEAFGLLRRRGWMFLTGRAKLLASLPQPPKSGEQR